MGDKFYNKNWFMWVMLLVFAPVGIYLMWKHNRFKKGARIGLSILFMFIFIAIMVPDVDKTETDENNTVAEIEVKTDEVASEPVVEEPVVETTTTEDTTTQEETVATDEEKNSVIAFDNDLWAIVLLSEAANQELFTALTTEGITTYDIYTAGTDAESKQRAIYEQISGVSYGDIEKGKDNAKKYKEAVENYSLASQILAENVVKYADTGENKYLAKVEEYRDIVNNSTINVAAARGQFLYSSVLTEEEVKEMLGVEE